MTPVGAHTFLCFIANCLQNVIERIPIQDARQTHSVKILFFKWKTIQKLVIRVMPLDPDFTFNEARLLR